MTKAQAKLFKEMKTPQDRQEFTCRLYITTMHKLLEKRGMMGIRDWELHMLYSAYESVDHPKADRIAIEKYGEPYEDKIVNILVDNS